jgi:hypothetical protein
MYINVLHMLITTTVNLVKSMLALGADSQSCWRLITGRYQAMPPPYTPLATLKHISPKEPAIKYHNITPQEMSNKEEITFHHGGHLMRRVMSLTLIICMHIWMCKGINSKCHATKAGEGAFHWLYVISWPHNYTMVIYASTLHIDQR